ncbi:transcriptional regulator [Rhodococcus sp. NPDC058521]|uniref:transcriptional regulator n=1 Tax=Rhodococcus sp. NPDC058521 TaxID=3346536 RepID=UPI003665E4B3
MNSIQIASLSIRPLFAKAVAEGGVVGMWTTVGGPATAGAYGEGMKKAFSEHATGMLSTLLVDAPVGAGLRAVVVAVPGPGPCGIECRALAAALATEGVNTRLVTALDRRARTAVIAAELPDVVVLWIEDANADPMAVIGALKRRVRGLTFVVGGSSSVPESLPGSVHACGTLPEAVATVVALARRSGRRPR